MNDNRRRPPAQRAANNNRPSAPLLTLDRAIADGLSPASLWQVAQVNLAAGGYRRERQGNNLIKIAERLELLGYGRAA